MKLRKVLQGAVCASVTVAGLGTMTTAAEAATGGGCTSHPSASPCISKTGNYVYSDFYVNRPMPDSSMHKAALMVYVNGRHVKTQWYEPLSRSGRHGPISHNVASLPSGGNAYTKVRVYNRAGAMHFEVNSPTVRW